MVLIWVDELGLFVWYCLRYGWGMLNWNLFLYFMIFCIFLFNVLFFGYKVYDLILKFIILFIGRVCWSWKGSRGGF